MSGKQQGLRYFQKFLNSKASERNALAKKVLRYVLAVGFALSPWLGGEAYAAGIERIDNITLPNGLDKTYLQTGNDVAHIYAEQASRDVGLNRFKTFEVGAGQIANLYFKTSATGATLNYLVNTVEGEINISGTVNAIRNKKIGGNLYFMSPTGMVVGYTGVINAGSLTVLANNDTFTTAEGAHYAIYEAVKDYQYWKSPNIDSYITINGKINTETGIDLRAAVVQIKQATSNSVSPSLLTGVVFNEVVNTDKYDNIQIYPINEKRLTLTNENGKIVIKNPTTLEEITSDGNGKINIYARNFNVGSFIGTFALNHGSIDSVGELRMDVGTSITVDSNTSIKANQITILNHSDNFVNNGTITGSDAVSIVAGNTHYKELSSINNVGTIESEAGIMSFTATNSFTNTGTIQADGQIKFAVGGTLTNKGTIESTSSNVQAHIGRDFKNIAVPDPSDSSKSIGGIIEAGGNVQIDYNLDTEHTYIGVATPETGEKPTIDGIYNSGLIWAKGDEDPVYVEAGNISSSGSGNIWLTSAYNITNDGTMKANRQITLNARDFLHNHGLIQGVTYLDIKSIMGYVYNHASGVIRATGGNIDLSTGQVNLEIKDDFDNTKKEAYRKFTPIIIEGSVEATSALNNTTNETNQGNINIRAYLGDIYVNGGTIEAKAGTSGEVDSVAGDVILDAAQNITIGFETVKAKADDPTTQAGPNGENKDKYERNDEREYFINTSTLSQKAAEISGSNITLISGSGKTISMSAVNNLTASDAVNFETAEMDFAGGTITANKISASGQLNVTGGSLSSTSGGSLTISGAEGLTLGAGAGISTDKDLTITSEKGSILNNAVLMANNGSLTMSGAGSVNAGTVTGKDVVLSSGGGSGITADKIIVDTSLQLQGNDIAVTEIDRSNNPDVLKVDVFGAGGASSAVKGDLQLNIAGNVLFNTMNVTNADITVGGALGVDKLHVEGEAHFNSNEQKIGVFGDAKAPVDDDSDAMYRDLGDGNNSWMSITMDSEGYEIKNGSEINNIFGDSTVDPVEMSTKLLDFNPHETFVETFGTSVNIFSRMDLIEAPERPAGDIAPVPQGGKTVLKHDANGLHIEEEKEEKR